MKEKIVPIIIVLLMFLAGFGVVNVSADDTSPTYSEGVFPERLEFVPGEVLVEFNEGSFSGEEYSSFLVDEYGGISIESREDSRITTVFVDEGDELSYCQSVENDPRIKFAEPNYITYVSKTPNDPRYSSQWGLRKIKCPEGWDSTTGNSNVKIAIIDTGVDYTHVDLADNCIEGYDFVDIDINYYLQRGYKKDPDEEYTTRDANPMDVNGHGTHCAGIASAVTDNGEGVAGVGWSCSIMPVRAGFSLIVEYEGVDYKVGVLENVDIIDAIDYAADNGADVISMSFGSSTSSSAVESACNRAWSAGVVLCAATGNDYRGSCNYPARYDKVIGVGSINSNNERSDFSNYGTGLSLMAPGEDIVSTVPGDGYAWYDGTSMACPHVAGVAGLAISRYSSYSNPQIRDLLEDSADYLGSFTVYGNGLVDATFEGDSEPEPEEITITITMHYIETLDSVDLDIPLTQEDESMQGEWFYEVIICEYYDDQVHKQRQTRYNKEHASWNPFGWNSVKKWNIEDGNHIFSPIAGQYWVDIIIRVYDWDGFTLSDISDVSACNNADGDWSWAIQDLDGREYAVRYWLDDNSITTIANPCEDKIEEGGYYIGNGEEDDSGPGETLDKLREDDCKVAYQISDNYNPPGVQLEAEGFNSPYFSSETKWVEPNKDVTFTANIDGGFGPFDWELDFGDESSNAEGTTGERQITQTHQYTLNNGKTRTLAGIPDIWVTDYLGKSKQDYMSGQSGMHVTNKPSKPSGGKEGLNVWAQSTDPEGDDICYIFTWSDDTTTRVPSSGFVDSGTKQSTRIQSSGKVRAVDEHGAAGDSLSFSKSKSKTFENPYLFRSIFNKLLENNQLLKQLLSILYYF